MSQDENWFVQHSFKVGDDLVNIRGRDVAHLRHNVAEYAEAVAEIAQLKANITGAQSLGGIVQPQQQTALPQQAPAQPVQQAPQQSAWGQQPVQQQNPVNGGPANGQPHPQGRACGQCSTVLQYKSGTSKAGNPYRMWACPNGRAKGDGHESEFIR